MAPRASCWAPSRRPSFRAPTASPPRRSRGATVGTAARAALSTVGLALHRVGRAVSRQPALRILYYHSISDDPVRSAVSPVAFERQMQYLSRSPYHLLS